MKETWATAAYASFHETMRGRDNGVFATYSDNNVGAILFQLLGPKPP